MQAAYGGDGPYVFVSYSHADKLVLRELGWLQDNGIDLWYDEGIHPGSRWTDHLARQIKDSKLVLYFVTPNSAGSENCRNEIDYAIENHKHILVVHLEETELAEGQKLALNSFQAIMRPELAHKEYRAKLLLAITEALEMEFDAAQFRPGRAPLPKWVPAVAVVSMLAVLGIGYTTVDILRQPPVVRAATDTLRSIISDFENHSGEAIFSGTLEEALRIGLEAAPFIDIFPHASALNALREMDSAQTELNAVNARLVGARLNVGLILQGSININATGYDIKVQGVEALTGRLLVETSGAAATRADVLHVLNDVVRELRQQLGDVSASESDGETVTTTSVGALSHYLNAQAAALRWEHDLAIEYYKQATELDPEFGRAYSGWAYSAATLGNTEEAQELFDKAGEYLDNMTERERLRTLGFYYSRAVHNYDKAKETFEELLAKYPSDSAAMNNLGMLYFTNRDFLPAQLAGANLLELYPGVDQYLANYSLFSMYAGDWQNAERSANELVARKSDYFPVYLSLAASRFIDRDLTGVQRAYESMRQTGVGVAAIVAGMGEADLLLARGDANNAIRVLKQGVDAARGDNHATTQQLWLAEAHLMIGDDKSARTLLSALEASVSETEHLTTMGQLFVKLGELERAESVATQLIASTARDRRAFGHTLQAEVTLSRGDHNAALDHARKAIDLITLWDTRFVRARTYLQAEENLTALAEFEDLKRDGEALSRYLDDIPTFRVYAEIPYWIGRAQEARGNQRAANRSFQEFLEVRDLGRNDEQAAYALERVSGHR